MNNSPVILNKFTTKVIRYGISTTVLITATDPDADTLSFSAKKMPSFGSFNDNGNGTASLIFNPSQQQEADYPGIKITVKDGHTGIDSNVFTLTVNDNYSPVIDSIADYVLNEGDVVTIPLSATDQNTGDTLNWSVSGVPNDYSIVPVSNGKINLVLRPTYGASGIYKISATVDDGKGGTGIRQFNLTVNDKDPSKTIYVRFKNQDTIGSPWNSVTSVTSSNFKDNLNNATTVGLAMQTTWWGTGNAGPQTGNNSGIYPDAVLKDYYYFGSSGGPQTVTSKITGLDTSKLYSINFYGGSIWSGTSNNGTTIYTIGTLAIPLNVQNNTTNTANFNIVKPATDGTISFTMSKGANTFSGYINAIVIKSIFTDSLKPAAPAFLSAVNISSGKGVQLSWNDVAYNETGYNVYRALKSTGPFTLINSNLPFNSVSYLDTTAAGNTQYFYMVKASNAQGTSDSSNIVNIVTVDRVPVIQPIASVTIKNNQQQTINVIATDDSADHITLTVSNLPSFVTFKDNGNGTGLFTVTPSSGITGTFEDITVTATDKSDSASSALFNITVTDQSVNSVYINFSSGTTESSPWNNLTTWPVANTTLSNLYDDNNSLTSISLKLMNGFQGNFSTGMQPGNNKTVYPDTVVLTGEYEGSTKTDSMQISGLSKAKKYNFVFFNSHDDGQNGNTNFTINGQTVTLNATHNINKTAQINGIVPDVNGQVMIKISKATGANYAYLNSLVIQSYDSSQTLLTPSDLRVVGITRTSVNLQWADRSADETGFEIWRITDSSNSSYILLKTVAANSTSYIDSNLNSGHTYYYTIRAIKAGLQSGYCNVVAATIYSQVIFVNFTFINNANVPWNNTSALPQQGLVWNNLFDNTGIPSSISMQETGVFAGLYGPGMNTGNNSGVFPDKVLADSYGLFTGESATMKVTGLNLNMKYDFTLFASSQVGGDVNTAYTVNGKKGVLNASLNTDGTVTIYNIIPDKNGEAVITITPDSFSSQYGLIGALVMQEYNAAANSIPSPPQSFGKTGIASTNKTQQASSVKSDQGNKVVVYPNPFNQSFIVSMQLERKDNVEVELYDAAGKLIYRKNFGDMLQGTHSLKLTTGQNISAGLYLVKVIYNDTKTVNYIKILKE